MAFTASTGRGVNLEISSDDVTYVTIGEVSAVNPSIDVTSEETTKGTTASKWTEWIPGAGTVDLSVTVNWDASLTEHYATILAHLFLTRYFKMTHGADGTVWKCQGHYTNVSPAIEKNTKMEATLTLRLTGTPNFNFT
jgi:hypothetical protein